MPGFEYGARRAISEIIVGLITSVILNAFLSSGLLDPSYALLFDLLNVAGTVVLILAMPFWGTVYLTGWLFGLTIMFQAGLVGILELVIYFGVPLVILIIRVLRALTE